MFKTKQALKRYLIENGLIAENESIEPVLLGGGAINHITRVKTKNRSFVIKQAEENAKFKKDIILSQKRVTTERNAIVAFAVRTHSRHIPKILHFDKEEALLIMEEIPETYEMLTYSLLLGDVNNEIARKIGIFLAQCHSSTYHDKKLKEIFPITEMVTKLKIGLFHKEFMDSVENQTSKRNIQSVIDRYFINKIVLVHGDVLPKNILVNGNNFYFLDYEIAHVGDPAHDIGTIIAHYLLPAIINYPVRKRYYAAAKQLLTAYKKNSKNLKHLMKKIMRNSLRHIPSLLYARACGTVHMEFLDNRTREVIKNVARKLAENPAKKFRKVTALIDKEAKSLTNNKPLTKEQLGNSRVF